MKSYFLHAGLPAHSIPREMFVCKLSALTSVDYLGFHWLLFFCNFYLVSSQRDKTFEQGLQAPRIPLYRAARRHTVGQSSVSLYLSGQKERLGLTHGASGPHIPSLLITRICGGPNTRRIFCG